MRGKQYRLTNGDYLFLTDESPVLSSYIFEGILTDNMTAVDSTTSSSITIEEFGTLIDNIVSITIVDFVLAKSYITTEFLCESNIHNEVADVSYITTEELNSSYVNNEADGYSYITNEVTFLSPIITTQKLETGNV